MKKMNRSRVENAIPLVVLQISNDAMSMPITTLTFAMMDDMETRKMVSHTCPPWWYPEAQKE